MKINKYNIPADSDDRGSNYGSDNRQVSQGGSYSGGSGGSSTTYAQTAGYADKAGEASRSQRSDFAAEANHAAEADHATTADSLSDTTALDSLYLSKTGDDTAEGKITFKKGAEFGADGAWGYVKQVVEGGTTKVKSWLKNLYTDVFETAVAKVTDYLTGGGGLLTVKGDLTTTKDTENGKLGDVRVGGTLYADAAEIERLLAGEISVDKLTAKVAHFFELSIDEIKSVGGQIILTPANAEIDRVETLGNGDYKCYFKATDGERKITQQFAAGDQVVCATFDAATGTSYNVSNKYYWRLVTEVSSGVVQIDGDDYHYIVMSGTDKDSDSTGIPEAGDKIAQLGSRSSADRQSAIILSAYNGEFLDKGIQAPSMVQYSGINDFTLSSHRQTVISKGLNEFRGTFRATSGKTIEDIIDEQTTEKASEAAPYINDSGYWVVNGVVTDKKARGEQGDKGDSVTVTGSVVKYSTKTTSSKPADSTFTQNSAPTGVKNGYVWSKTTVTYSDGSSVSAYSCTYQGKDGRSMTSKTTYYAVTDDEEQPRDSDFVSTEFPVVAEGQWVWTRTVETYSEGSDVVSYGVYRVGTDGVDGVSGEPGQDGRNSYMHIAYAMDAAGTGFSLTYFDGALYIGTYTDDQQADASDYTKYEWARLKGEKGDTGQKGDKGETGAQGPAGKSSYTHIKRMSDFLPEGYTKLQWTGSRRTGTYPYLSTGLGTSVTAGFKLRYRHHYTDANGRILSGQLSNSSYKNNGIFTGRDGNDGFYVRWGQQYYPANAEDRPTLPAETWAVASVNFNDTRKWTLETETGVTAEGDLDGEIYTDSSGRAYNNFSLSILGYNNQSRNMDVSDYQLTQNGKLAAWFIPARREEDGKVGMYDIVRQQFRGPLPESTSYTFTAGPEDEANWGDRYIGIAVTESAEAPTNAAAYDWMQVGGAGVKGMTRHYLLTNAAEGVTWDTAGWTTTAGQTSSEQKYLWEYDEVEYTDGRSSVKTTPVRTGMYAEDAELYVIRHVSNTLRAEDGMLTGRAAWSLHHIVGSTDTEEDITAEGWSFRWKTDTGSQWQEVTGAAFAVELNNTAEYYNSPHAVMVEAMKAGVTVASDTASIVWNGTEVYTADFDDEMLSVACDEDGNVLDENVLYDWLPKARLYKGSKLVEKDRREWFKYFNAYSEELYLGTTSYDDCVEAGIDGIKPAFNNKDTAKIDVYYYATEAECSEAQSSGDYLTDCIAHCTATINKVRTGKDAEMWSLMVSDNALHKGKNDTTATPAQVTVKVVRTKGTERTEMDFAAWTAAGLTVTYTLNGQTRGGSASHYPIVTSGATTALRVELRKGTTLIDVETVPLVTDGKDGTSVSIKGSYATRALIESTVTNPSVGDGYIDLSTGHLIVYTGVTDPGDNSPWEDVGQVKGDAGDSSYLFIAWMKGDASGRTGTMVYGEPTDDTYTWWGYAVSMTNMRPTTESDYTWQYVKGGKGDAGERGPAGEKGDASVTHVRYSDDGKTFKYRDQTYREVEFIENQYRYNGYIPVNAYGGHGSETRIVIDFMLTARASASYNNCLFAFRHGSSNYTNRIQILYSNGGKCLRLMMYAGDAKDSTTPAEELIDIPYEFGTRMKIDMSYAGVTVNDMDVYHWPEGKDYSTWKETAYALRLFTGQSGSTAWGSNYYAYGRIYSLQIWQGDELTLDNVPCINEETKKVVMWNRAKDAIGFVANNDTMGYSLSSGREKGENRLLNGDFSQGLDYWYIGDDGNVMTAEAVSVDGKGTALRLLSSDVTTVNGKNNAVRSGTAAAGNRFLGYQDTEAGCWVSFDVRAESAATFIVGVTWNSQASYLKVAEVEATTEWTHHEAWIAKPTNYYLRQIVLNAGTANVAIYVTRVKVEYGDKATAWSASPDDGDLYRNYKVGGKYRGEYTDNTLADSEQFSDYVWVQAEGEQGPQGEPGEPGEPGKSAEMYVIRTEKNDLHVDQSGTIRGGIRAVLHHIVGSEDAAVESGFTYSYGLDTTGATEVTLSGKINVNAYDGMDVEEYVSGGNYPRSLTVTVRKDGAVVATEVYQMVYDGEKGDSIEGEPAEFHRLYTIAEKAVVGYSETTKKYPLALELVYQIQHIVGGTTSYEDVSAANGNGYWLRFRSDVDSTNVNFTDGVGTKTGRYVNSDYIADYHTATAKPTMLTVELCHKNGTAVEVVDTRTVMVTFATSAALDVVEELNAIVGIVQGSDGLVNKVSTLKQDMDGIQGRVTKTETGIGSLNDQMSQKVDTSTFTQRANDIESEVKSVEKKLPDTKNLFGASVYEGGALGDDESNTWKYVWGGVKHYCPNMDNYGTPIHKGEFTWYNQQNGNTALYSPCVQLDADWYTLRMRLYKIELGSMKIEVRRYRNQTDDPSNYIGSYTVADWWDESDTDKEDNRLRLFRNQIPQEGHYRLCLINGNHNDSLNENDNDLSDLCGGDIQLYRGQLESSDFNDFDTTMSEAYSRIRQTANEIELKVKDTGIDIENGTITLDANKTIVNGDLQASKLLTNNNGYGYIDMTDGLMKVFNPNGINQIIFGVDENGNILLQYLDKDSGRILWDLGPNGLSTSASQDERVIYNTWCIMKEWDSTSRRWVQVPLSGYDTDILELDNTYRLIQNGAPMSYLAYLIKNGINSGNGYVYQYEAKINAGQYIGTPKSGNSSVVAEAYDKLFLQDWPTNINPLTLQSGSVSSGWYAGFIRIQKIEVCRKYDTGSMTVIGNKYYVIPDDYTDGETGVEVDFSVDTASGTYNDPPVCFYAQSYEYGKLKEEKPFYINYSRIEGL